MLFDFLRALKRGRANAVRRTVVRPARHLSLEVLEKRILPAGPPIPIPIIVKNTDNAGPGSLRAAIIQANAAPGKDTILLEMPFGTIRLQKNAPLPPITSPVVIKDGPGTDFERIIDGGKLGARSVGLVLTAGASGSEIDNLTIQGFAGAGVRLDGASSCLISDDIIVANGNGVEIVNGSTNNTLTGDSIGNGLTAGVGSVLSNTKDGVFVSKAPGNFIGVVGKPRNVISGNGANGINILDSANTVIINNFIGTDAGGTMQVSNGKNGVYVHGTSFLTTIGGTVATNVAGVQIVPANLISGNLSNNILFEGGGGRDNGFFDKSSVLGNFIGTNLNGNAELQRPEGAKKTVVGVQCTNASDIVIGSAGQGIAIGVVPGDRNIIDDFTDAGILISNSLRISIVHNYVGADLTGTKIVRLAPQFGSVTGIRVEKTSRGILIGAFVGLSQPANLIVGCNKGIDVKDSNSQIFGNFIGTNADASAPLPNDIGIRISTVVPKNKVIIGGSLAWMRNIISGNSNYGIMIGGDVEGVMVDNNNIGIGASRVNLKAIPNGIGVKFQVGSKFNKASNNIIAGNKAGNVNDEGLNKIVDPNLIYGVGVIPIDNGTTTGTPLLTSASVSGSATTITGSLTSTPSSTFDLEFFGSTFLGPGGSGEGEVYLGTSSVTTNASGYATFSVTLNGAYGEYTSATSTGRSTDGSTSEFSAGVAVTGYPAGSQPSPSVTSLSTSTGTTAGGTSITVTGSNFDNVQSISFGGVLASQWTVNSTTSLTVTDPPSYAGMVDVTVATAVGPSALSSDDQFTYVAAPAPAVTSLGASTGTTAGGTVVTISGTHLLGASDVLFGGVPAASYFIASDTSIIAVAPSQAVGSVDVTVATPTGTSALSSADQFTYTAAPAPTVTALSASTGTAAGGTTVTITGTHFTSATGVSFGGVAATDFSVLSDTTLMVTTPAQVAATVHLTVTAGGGTSTATSSDLFTYSATSAPVVSAVTPGTGSSTGGTSVTILGNGFTAATTVSFGSIAVSFTLVDDKTLLATAPAGLSGTVDIAVTTTSGTSATSSADHFTYISATAPTLTALSSITGTTAGGTRVVLTGTGFLGVSAVYFGNVPAAAFVVNSDTQLTVLSPARACGTIDITVASASGSSAISSASRFAYTLASAPAITSLGATTGTSAGGTSVLVTGIGFTGATGVNFGGVPASTYTVLSDTQISATSPSLVAATVNIRVTTWAGSSAPVTGDQFVYTAAGTPTVTGLATSTGSLVGGTLVTINGTNFTSATSVQFGSRYAGFVVNSATSITAWAPAQFAGTVHVTVSTASGTSSTTSADQFVYTSATGPAVTGLSLATGTTAAGDAVVILGSGFSTAVGVSFGSIAATNFQVLSDNAISVQTPMQAAGTVHVLVTTYAGTSSAGTPDQFTYTNVTASAPAVTALDLTSGSTAGGQTVTITGSSFTGASAVSFGGTAATSFVILSDTQISAVVPAKAAGTIDVTVTNNTGTSATGGTDQFAYLSAGIPTVTSLGTTSGTTAGGTSVNITGTNFTSASQVYFGWTAAASFTVNSATSITAFTNVGYASVLDVTVKTPSGTSAISSADQYAYTAAPAPAITSLGTSSGTTAGGTSVTINGTDFGGVTQVLFGGVPAASFAFVSGTQITAVTPADFSGVVDTQVVTTAGSSAPATAARFTFSAASTSAVTSLGTTTGSTDGGTTVVLTGTDFTGASAVSFGGVPAASFTVNSSTQITATTPASVVGVVSVTVTTPTGISAGGGGTLFTYTASSAPTVTSLGTSTGSTGGGTSVAITGTNFTAATVVLFGSTPASFTIGSSTQITATAPSGTAGTVDVTVGTLVTTSATSSSDQYTYSAASAPAVSGLGASTGSIAGGSPVVITGSNFTGATDVQFGGVSAGYFTVLSDGAISTFAPGGVTGTVDVQVVTASGTSTAVSADHFTYTAVTAPTITSLSASSDSAAGGTTVTITGTGFATASGVSVGGQQVAYNVLSDTGIAFVTPAMAPGSYDLAVGVPGADCAPARFAYTAASAPTVTSLGATTGSTVGGTAVNLTGTNFTGATQVRFGTASAASFTVLSSTSIQVIAPGNSAAGVVDVTVTGPGGMSAVATGDQYTYTAASTPTLTAISLTSGSTAGGTVLNLTGTGFLGATSVAFGTLAAGFTVWSDTWITATTPASAAGSVSVTVASPGGTSGGISFAYYAPSAPTVTGLTVTGGSTAGGYTTTVTGTNFTAATGVVFGSTPASYTVLSDTALSVTVPVGTAGTVDVTVTTAGGTSSAVAADHFVYATPSTPTLTGLTPGTSSGSSGAVVTITGTNFTNASAVSFGTVSAGFVVNSATSITAVAPAQASGTIDVTVTTAGGPTATSSSSHFTYTSVPAPAVAAVGPAAGPLGGGNGVLITGTGFLGTSLVQFGSASAVTFTVLSDTSILATAPSGSAGIVDVKVTTPAGTSTATTADSYAYQAVPTLTSLSASTDTATGGTQINLTGTNFTGATAVYFGGNASPSFTVNSDTSVTATVPAGPVGSVGVSVYAPGGGSGTQAFTFTAASTAAWVGGSTGSWGTGSNWSGGVLPTSSADVAIPSGVTVTLSSGTATVHQLNVGGTLAVGGGSLTALATSTVATLNLSSGAFTATGALTVTGSLGLAGGTLGAGGTVTIASGATAALGSAGGPAALTGGKLVNLGAATLAANPLTLSSATIDNRAGATLTSAGGTYSRSIGGAGTLLNEGTLTQSGGLTTTIGSGVTFANTGTANVTAGTLSIAAGSNGGTIAVSSGAALSLQGTFTLTGASSVGGAGSLTIGAGTTTLGGAVSINVTIAGGATLSGSGAIAGNVTNNGTLAVGGASAVGTLTITGNFTQGSGGTLQLELASATSYGVLNVSGTASLAGTLNIGLIGGYTPSSGTSFTLIDYGSHNGFFGSSTGGYSQTYNSTNLQSAVYSFARADSPEDPDEPGPPAKEGLRVSRAEARAGTAAVGAEPRFDGTLWGQDSLANDLFFAALPGLIAEAGDGGYDVGQQGPSPEGLIDELMGAASGLPLAILEAIAEAVL